jgi:hypothetical protein
MKATRNTYPDPVAPPRWRQLPDPSRSPFRNVSAPVLCGLFVGGILAASPLAFWWLPRATVYALGLILIASVYIGFSVADGRWKVIAAETGVAAALIVTAATAVTRASVAPRSRTDRPRTQRPMATPDPLRRQHAMVAAVLRRHRLGRRRPASRSISSRNPGPLAIGRRSWPSP